MALDLRSIFPSESFGQDEAGGGLRDHMTTICAASVALLIVAAIAVLIGMI